MNSNLRNVLLVTAVVSSIAAYNYYSDPKNKTAPATDSTEQAPLQTDTASATVTDNDTSKGSYADALMNYTELLTLKEQQGDKSGMASQYWKIAGIYSATGDDAQALENYMKALKIEEELGNKQEIADLYYNIGIVYNREQDRSAINYFTMAQKMYDDLGNTASTDSCKALIKRFVSKNK